MQTVSFRKYHGCGNDFIFIEYSDAQRLEQEQRLPDFIQAICNRHFGIGADGVIFSEKIEAQYKMHYYNSDGSTAAMCGNGMRAFRQYLRDVYNEDAEQLVIMTRDAEVIVTYQENGVIDVNIGKVNQAEEQIIDEKTYFQIYTMTDHIVRIDEKIPENWQIIGATVEKNSIFPKGTNVNFVEIISDNKIKIETWERGAGATQACGTGACASAIIYQQLFGTQESLIEVQVAGGKLQVNIQNEEVHLIGTAELIAIGTYFFRI